MRRALIISYINTVFELLLFASRFIKNLKTESLGIKGFCVEFFIPQVGTATLKLGDHERVRIIFRDKTVALKVFMGLKSIPEAFGEGWIRVEGPVELATCVTMFFEIFESIVFPYTLFKHLYRGRPKPSLERLVFRLLIYLYLPLAILKVILKRSS